ncbi:hypothetical protein HYG81_13895 [Natrinema zhouii]|uniref:PGF-CTERM sorting domain-containing protein n=1 Tax=Natrinema zhouii TaxID=1710539 RepID=A0A7D6CNK7_9EURY|nr:hypothetical protein [Natrinema zhouii]QLK25176.1 hypothetical protein HYG81_13895 [Natrinema zhouii]
MSSKSKPNLRSTDEFRAFLAVFLVAVVGVATIGLPVVFGGPATTVEATEPAPEFKSYDSVAQAESELGAADDIYLGENGSAVLRYDDETDVNKFEAGMDVSEGLVHMLVVDDYENSEGELESANFSAILDQQGLSGSGSLIMQQPEDLQDLSIDVSGEVSEDTNEFDATASGTFDSEAETTGAVSTSGSVAVTADRLETSGDVSVEMSDMGGAESDMYLDATVEEQTDGYEVAVSQKQTVDEGDASRWETRKQAKQTLQRQYGTYAALLGGDSTVSLTNYDFEEGPNGKSQLEIDFTIEYTGVDNGIEEQLTDQLANDPSTDLSRSDAEEIATSVTDLEIETISFTVDASDSSVDANWDVSIANYDELTFAMFDLAEATDTDDQLPEDQLEDARAAIEAQQAAGLETELTWDGSIEQTSSETMTFDATLASNTENWDAYIDELESRDIEPPNDVTFELTATTDGDQLAVDGEFELEGEDLVGQAIKSVTQSAQTGPSGSTMSADADQFVSALAESELEIARIDAGLEDGTVRVEGGAKFEDMSKLTDTVSESMAISGMATEQNGETVSTYVYVDEMADIDTSSATKSDLEHLDVVDSETTVHQAGEWDDEFPEIDTDEMSEFLTAQDNEETSENEDEDEDDSDSVPGFGIGIGLASIAGLLTALVLRRQT